MIMNHSYWACSEEIMGVGGERREGGRGLSHRSEELLLLGGMGLWGGAFSTGNSKMGSLYPPRLRGGGVIIEGREQ